MIWMDDICDVDGLSALSAGGITLTLTSNGDGGDFTVIGKIVTNDRGSSCVGVGATSNDGDGGDCAGEGTTDGSNDGDGDKCAGEGATNGGDASLSSLIVSSLPVSNSIGLLLLDDPNGCLCILIDKSDLDDEEMEVLSELMVGTSRGEYFELGYYSEPAVHC